jgi:hypothetical protein
MRQNTLKRFLIRSRAEYIHGMYHWQQHSGVGGNTQYLVAEIQMLSED